MNAIDFQDGVEGAQAGAMNRLAWLFTALLALPAAAQTGAKKMGNKKKALIVVTSNDRLGESGKKTGWHLGEVTHVYWPLVEAGFEVDFASPRGGAAPLDESSRNLEDAENKKYVEDARIQGRLKATLPLSKVDPRGYAAVHLAGGHGTMWDFPADRELQRVVAGIYEGGGVVAAVCHGPAGLVDVKLSSGSHLVAGKDVSAFTDAEEEQVGYAKIVPFLLASKLQQRGARHQAGPNWTDQTSVSGRLITGQNPQSAKSVGRKLVELLRAPAG
jgi:putative intracellular protease/amidase